MNDEYEKPAAKLAAAANSLQLAARISSLPADRFASVYYNDKIYNIRLNLVEFCPYQQQILMRRQPLDSVLLLQLFDLLPNLKGKGLIDVGGYTGLQSLVIADQLDASYMHVFEPQKVALSGLKATLEASEFGQRSTVYDVVIDEEDQILAIANARPDRLSRASFIHREGGAYKARSLDSLDLSDIGLLHVDFQASKINLLRGATNLISQQKPVIVMDLSGRDIAEIDIFLENFDYISIRSGGNYSIFLPQ